MEPDKLHWTDLVLLSVSFELIPLESTLIPYTHDTKKRHQLI